MAGTAALLRSMARRSKTPMQASALALTRPQPQPLSQPGTSVLSRRPLFFHGGLLRREDLPPVAPASRLFSSGSAEPPNKNHLPPCTEPATDVEPCRIQQKPLTFIEYIKENNVDLLENNQIAGELKRQIVEKKEELFHLLLHMDAKPGSSVSGSKKCLEEELLHLLREFQAKTQGQRTPSAAGLIKFLNFSMFGLLLVFYMSIPGR